MILRRLADAIRHQDWFTVVIEFVIVVVGIFVALQVDGWNQRRLDHAIGQQYLENIRAAIRADIDMLNGEIEQAKLRRVAAEYTLRAIKTGTYDDAGLFIRQVDQTGRWDAPTYQRAAYEDLVATGSARFISPALRDQLHEYYRSQLKFAQVDSLQKRRVWENYLPIAVDAMPLEAQRWVYDVLSEDLVPLEGPPEIEAYAIETLKNLQGNEGAGSALKAVIRGSWTEEQLFGWMLTDAEEMLAKLNEALDSKNSGEEIL